MTSHSPSSGRLLTRVAAAMSPAGGRSRAADGFQPVATHGRVRQLVGLAVEAVGLEVGIGDVCEIERGGPHGGATVLAEVVGFNERGVVVVPYGDMDGIGPGAAIRPLSRAFAAAVGDGLLGRIINALGEPIDSKGPILTTAQRPLMAPPPHPLTRTRITRVLETGVRAIDGLLTIGRGQRVGIFAGSGVGKSTLLGQIARQATAADARAVNVIALIGERGREVQEFIEHALGPEGLARSVVVVATGDQAALLRARGALLATTIAEQFRDDGRDVVLMLDSVTRIAMAWREVGLAAGEPPTTKGYPPSVFAHLPRLLERAGNGQRGGITGLYTVLVDGDDFNEPVADAARGILDGHIVLTRALAAKGHYPAIDILDSKSRVRDQLIDQEQLEAARVIVAMEASYRQQEDMINAGVYHAGTNAELDRTIAARPRLLAFLQQRPGENTQTGETRAFMQRLRASATGAQSGA